ncbi:hypothetical protein DIPPA_13817 [Diplonema papillatum]|nr:hypothetical protein DIPPA_13817 [Diplonema papillatum]
MPIRKDSRTRRAALKRRRVMDPDWAAAEEAADGATREWRMWNPCEPGETMHATPLAGKEGRTGRC